jgi:hypothetical protein
MDQDTGMVQTDAPVGMMQDVAERVMDPDGMEGLGVGGGVGVGLGVGVGVGVGVGTGVGVGVPPPVEG